MKIIVVCIEGQGCQGSGFGGWSLDEFRGSGISVSQEGRPFGISGLAGDSSAEGIGENQDKHVTYCLNS